jgi:TfoX/Sxy family transcriptional regulator of competence genes
MATRQDLTDYLTEQMGSAANVRSRKMFGEYAIYCDEKVIALVCDDQLYLKVTAAGLRLLPEAEHGPAYPGAKPSIIVPEELYDNHEFMSRLARETAAELPLPKPKKR